jgi:hypothetical protein
VSCRHGSGYENNRQIDLKTWNAKSTYPAKIHAAVVTSDTPHKADETKLTVSKKGRKKTGKSS